MSLQSIANVTVTVTSKTVTQKGFGVPLLVGAFSTPAWPANVVIKTYEDAAAMVTEGFPADHPLVLMAQAVKSQDPSPPKFKIGRLHTFGIGANLLHDQTVRWLPDMTTEGLVYSFKVKKIGAVAETVISYTVQAGDTIADICTAVAALVDAVAGLDATAGATYVEITPTVVGETFDVYGWDRVNSNVKDITPDLGFASTLADLKDVDNDWYGLAVDINSDPILTSVTAWAEANGKLFGCNSTDKDMTVTGTFQGLSYARSFGLFKVDRLFNCAGAAWLGKMLPTQPGSSTWCYKTLAGVAVDNLYAQEDTFVTAGLNVYITIAGVNITYNGQTFGGTFIDQTVGIDWLVARMEEALFGALVSNPKIPYTDAGIDSLRSVALGIMQNGQAVGLLDPAITPTVRAPKISEISANDRALRKVPNFIATGRLAGAIHTLTMNIQLSI